MAIAFEQYAPNIPFLHTVKNGTVLLGLIVQYEVAQGSDLYFMPIDTPDEVGEGPTRLTAERMREIADYMDGLNGTD